MASYSPCMLPVPPVPWQCVHGWMIFGARSLIRLALGFHGFSKRWSSQCNTYVKIWCCYQHLMYITYQCISSMLYRGHELSAAQRQQQACSDQSQASGFSKPTSPGTDHQPSHQRPSGAKALRESLEQEEQLGELLRARLWALEQDPPWRSCLKVVS